MTLFFSTTPNPSSQEEGTTGGVFLLSYAVPSLRKTNKIAGCTTEWRTPLNVFKQEDYFSLS